MVGEQDFSVLLKEQFLTFSIKKKKQKEIKESNSDYTIEYRKKFDKSICSYKV